MKYVTVAMIAAHAQKHHLTVFRALKATLTPTVKLQGALGLRILRRDADKFLSVQWPEVGPMPATERTMEEARR